MLWGRCRQALVEGLRAAKSGVSGIYQRWSVNVYRQINVGTQTFTFVQFYTNLRSFKHLVWVCVQCIHADHVQETSAVAKLFPRHKCTDICTGNIHLYTHTNRSAERAGAIDIWLVQGSRLILMTP